MAEADKTPKKKNARPGTGWLSRVELAAALDVTTIQIDRRYAKLAPPEAVQRTKNRTWYHARKLIDAMIALEIAQAKAATGEGDPLLAGSDSPSLEKYRAARARLAELDLEERQKSHVRLADLDTAIAQFASHMRRAGEVLQRQWGADASEVLNRAIDQALADWRDRGNSRDSEN